MKAGNGDQVEKETWMNHGNWNGAVRGQTESLTEREIGIEAAEEAEAVCFTF